MLHYLIQIVFFQLLFLVIYDLFHKKDTFFHWNRLYLIITPILSLVLPFIKIRRLGKVSSEVYNTNFEKIITFVSDTEKNFSATAIASEVSSASINWWFVVYLIGMIGSLILFVLKIYKLHILKSISLKSLQAKTHIIQLPNSKQAFSFWNTIFLGDALSEEEKQQILRHELVHVQQKHSLDQLLFEILKIIFWWNPIVYFFQKRITVLHEYIADDVAISEVGKKKYLEQLLNATFQTQEITFVNQFFNQSLIKKRILMLQKSKSKTFVKFKYLLVIPVLVGILCYTSCTKETKGDTDVSQGDASVRSAKNDTFTFNTFEKECINQNAEFDATKNLSLKIENGPDHEVLFSLISTTNGRTARTVYLPKNTSYEIRHLPPDIYYKKVIYGEKYVEKENDGLCSGNFEDIAHVQVFNNILDYTRNANTSANDAPSSSEITYTVRLDLMRKEQAKKDTFSIINEPECPNANAKYNKSLDNYFKLTNEGISEAVVTLIERETDEVIRTIYLKKAETYSIKNIPENVYYIQAIYGEGYTEKTIDGVCSATFTKILGEENGEDILDFTVVKTKNGYNVPNFSMTVSLEE